MRTIIAASILLFIYSCIDQKPKVDLHTAVVTDNLEIIQQHIKTGSDLNIPEPTRQSSPIITAAAAGKTEAAKLLIDAGADLNYKNADGSTALHTAAVFGNNEIARLLINAGIDLNSKNNDGASPLHVAAFFGRVDIVKALLDKGADISIKNSRGHTALQTVEAPFEAVKPVYDAVAAGLRPLGVTLDYDQIKTARPQIAELLMINN
jgi:ankyrin repeat protein